MRRCGAAAWGLARASSFVRGGAGISLRSARFATIRRGAALAASVLFFEIFGRTCLEDHDPDNVLGASIHTFEEGFSAFAGGEREFLEMIACAGGELARALEYARGGTFAWHEFLAAQGADV